MTRKSEMRDVASLLNIAERATQRIVAELGDAELHQPRTRRTAQLSTGRHPHAGRATHPTRRRHRIPARHPAPPQRRLAGRRARLALFSLRRAVVAAEPRLVLALRPGGLGSRKPGSALPIRSGQHLPDRAFADPGRRLPQPVHLVQMQVPTVRLKQRLDLSDPRAISVHQERF
jgi:hypothetical protein